MVKISIHAPRAGRDKNPMKVCFISKNFNPRAPCRARRQSGFPAAAEPTISIHAPRAGRDRRHLCGAGVGAAISIHAPRAGRDARLCHSPTPPLEFQSTRPVQGATSRRCCPAARMQDFNPRAPCRARLLNNYGSRHNTAFQSTRPVQGATGRAQPGDVAIHISIHAPRAGRDKSRCPPSTGSCGNFNPRAPCRARQGGLSGDLLPQAISIHAPRAGRDGGSKDMG